MQQALFMSRCVVRRSRRWLATSSPSADRRALVRRSAGWLAPALLVAFLAPLAAGCGDDGASTSPLPPAPTPAPPASVRDRLPLADLFGSSPPGVLHNLYYQPIGAVRATSNALCGTLPRPPESCSTTSRPTPSCPPWR